MTNVFLALLDAWTDKADVMPELVLAERVEWWERWQAARDQARLLAELDASS